MDCNSKSVRVNGLDESSASASASASRSGIRKYSRDQLFELAKSIENYESSRADLEAARHADWTQYQLDVLPDERLAASGLMSRQNSELAERELHSLGQQHRKLTRMTSSPTTFRSAKVLDACQQPVSSQARAKYARLIETMSLNAASSQRANSARQPLGRANSHNTRAPPTERPGQVFGPLRRQQTHEGAAPEEPMSLPYSINSSAKRRESATERAQADPTPTSLDDDTLIKRFGSSGATANEQDDDDFDITNLLSITVLSDIRTIRQDLHSFGRQTSQLSASNTRAALARSRSHEINSRMPARSMTALDFNYEPRRAAYARPTPQQQLAAATAASGRSMLGLSAQQAGQYFSAARQPTCAYAGAAGVSSYQPSSLPPVASTLNEWPASTPMVNGLFVCAEMAPPAKLHKPSEAAAAAAAAKTKKPLDESVAKIIESFKAQVRARAAAADEAPQETRPPAKPQADAAASRGSKSPDEQINDAAANESRSSALPGERATLKAKANANANANTNTNANANASLSSPAGAETGTGAARSRVDNEAGSGGHANERLAGGKARVSHIPRLIALQERAKSNQNSASANMVTAAQDAQKDARRALAVATASATATATSSAAASAAPGRQAKFVSQYKRLRGKSLADEVAECKSFKLAG